MGICFLGFTFLLEHPLLLPDFTKSWLQTCGNPPASASRVLGFQACTTLPGSCVVLTGHYFLSKFSCPAYPCEGGGGIGVLCDTGTESRAFTLNYIPGSLYFLRRSQRWECRYEPPRRARRMVNWGSHIHHTLPSVLRPCGPLYTGKCTQGLLRCQGDPRSQLSSASGPSASVAVKLGCMDSSQVGACLGGEKLFHPPPATSQRSAGVLEIRSPGSNDPVRMALATFPGSRRLSPGSWNSFIPRANPALNMLQLGPCVLTAWSGPQEQ